MREDYGNINLETAADDDFGEMPMDETNSELRGGSVAREASLFNDEEPSINAAPQPGPSGEPGPSSKKSFDLEPPMDDGFGASLSGGDFGDSGADVEGAGGGLFDEPVMPEAEISNTIPEVS